jgi:bifunctional non-homologous end joining protein LigD
MAKRGVRSQPTLPALPVFISPMLAKKGEPFDSEEHLFEIKWDGTRMLAFVEHDGYRLVNRHRAERTLQYPELACLAELPAGVILDGEVVVFHEGRPDFRRLLSRDQAGSPLKIRLSARSMPATYVVFDLLYEGYRSLLTEPLSQRRQRLCQLVEDLGRPQVVFSEGIVGPGRALFEEACRQGLEGLVAKRLASRYRPGKRTTARLKIKPRPR